MRNISKKYPVPTLLVTLAIVAVVLVSCSPAGRGTSSRRARAPIFDRTEAPAAEQPVPERPAAELPLEGEPAGEPPATDSTALAEFLPDSLRSAADSIRHAGLAIADSTGGTGLRPDSLLTDLDILRDPDVVERTGGLTMIADTAGRAAATRKKDFLEHPVVGKSRDSLVYDVRNRLIFVYGEGDLTYEDNNLKADRMIINVATKEIYGVGSPDSTGVMSRPEFIQGGATYTMDTLTGYNLTSKRAKIKGVATKDGEGYLLGRDLKKMADNTINIAHAKYTTCDLIEHPHYYIAMTRAKVIPGKKIITGPAYFVMEDVPIYFLGIPGGFFPISAGPQSGFLMPQYGEEGQRGFYLRNGGYYFTFGDYADLSLTADIYTLGSWAVRGRSAYIKRYRFRGSFDAEYARTVIGEKNAPSGYQNNGNLKLNWTHSQDPKANPNQTFSANVRFVTAGYNKQAATTLNDHMNTQTSSSVSYGRTWTAGTTPINLTVSFNHTSQTTNSTINITLPNISFSVASFAPFKRKVQVGKQRWYEKVTLRYSMSAQNTTGSVKENELFSSKTLQNMMNGVSHDIPVQTSFNLFNYISFSPSFNYREVWNFKRQRRVWDPDAGQNGALVPANELPYEFGFFRTYSWNVNGSFSTKLYGMYTLKRKEGKTGWLDAVRHVVTPTVGFTYTPNFMHPRYGFVEYVQSSANGTYQGYNPNIGSPTMGASAPGAMINFSLSNQIEMKVRSKRDTTGTGLKKIPLIEQLSFSGSYDFLRDSMNLSPISITFRTGQIFKNFAINITASWDPYKVVDVGGQARQTKDFNIGNGKFGRLTRASWAFGYTFNSSNSPQPAMNDINSGAFVAAYTNPFDPNVDLDPTLRRQYMVSSYYDFTIPWNFGFNYSVSYAYPGLKPQVTQTFGFNGSVTLTQKWGVTFTGGFDIQRRRFTPMSVSLSRNLHCWDMSFQWIPFGQLKSYQFHIGISSAMLADIKYDKSTSHYDNLEL